MEPDFRVIALSQEIASLDVEAGLFLRGLQNLPTLPEQTLVLIKNEAELGLSCEPAFGRAYVEGMVRLASGPNQRHLQVYCRLVRNAAAEGTTLGTAVARGLSPAMKAPGLRASFLRALRVMARHGTHTLKLCTAEWLRLLSYGQDDAARRLALLCAAAYVRPLSYHQALAFSQIIPEASRKMADTSRARLLSVADRVARADEKLLEPFFEGVFRGLSLLSAADLDRFVDQALSGLPQKKEAAERILSLASEAARQKVFALQKAVGLSAVSESLARYLRARLNRTVPILSAKEIPRAPGVAVPGGDMFCLSDGHTIYLPDLVDRFETREENLRCIKALVKLEAGLFEGASFSFDQERAALLCRRRGIPLPAPPNMPHCQGLEVFCRSFALPGLFLLLFTSFEHARVNQILSTRYPGLWKACVPLFRKELARKEGRAGDLLPLAWFYGKLAFGARKPSGPLELAGFRAFDDLVSGSALPEASAAAARSVYGQWAESLGERALLLSDLLPDAAFGLLPFGRAVSPALWSARTAPFFDRAEKLVSLLRKAGVPVFLADVATMMAKSDGLLRSEEIREASRSAAELMGEPDTASDSRDIAALLEREQALSPEDIPPPPGASVFWYREYNKTVADFLPAHCRLTETLAARGPEEFYASVLESFPGLVSRIRKSFEILRPEGIKRLRRHVEGEDFDHRALIDLAVDLRSGRYPSERIYVKRVKQVRDVSALLLTDLSRSTANLVPGTDKSVLTVEKQAMVLFCEALSTVGDDFSVAGFSGAGRLRVDYVVVKNFAEPMSPEVRGRIGELSPMRNTRMGAALRHAVHRMGKAPGRVKVLIILSDGFPNDLEYKADYAVEDTRKALAEARARNIHIHAITVNLSDAARIDEIYRDVHRTVIRDASELPEKLPRIYRAITR
ncbi:MAG: VWA domain-containing protein [Thermodesulfobacteriota bacterium]